MFRRQAYIFSPLELEYLELNQDKPLDQLCIKLAKSRNAIIKQIKIINGQEAPASKKKRTAIGKRKDLDGLFVRSAWEANFLRYLKYNNIEYFYEPKVFYFEGIKHGTVSYLPDIYLPETDEYIEIKGQLTSQGRTAVNRFFKYFPEEAAKLKAVTGGPNTKASQFFEKHGVPIYAYMNDLNKLKKIIPNWE